MFLTIILKMIFHKTRQIKGHFPVTGGHHFILLIMISAILTLQSCDGDEPETPGISGVVLSSNSPVADASVTLNSNTEQYATTTGANGVFTFTEVVSGEYILTVKSTQTNDGFIQYQKNVTALALNQQITVELPKGVTLLEPSDISDASVSLSWTKSDINDFLEYKLYRHSTSGLDETTGTLIHVATDAEDTTFVSNNLLDNEKYFYRVFVRNTFGLYGGSNILEVTTAEGNYVNNGDFEQNLTSWEFFTPDPCAEIAIDNSSPGGSHVLKLEIADQSTANISSELFQVINQNKLIGGNVYTLSFWAKVEALEGDGLMYMYLNDTGTWSRWGSIELNKDSDNDWTEYSVDFIAPGSQSPYNLFIYAQPNIPWNNEQYKILLDGIELHRKK
jgi:hypothetical protein